MSEKYDGKCLNSPFRKVIITVTKKGGHAIVEKVRYMISDAAALAGVETHVLRYWEEELDLTIPRNEMGHRYYTRENIQEFQKIKELKEKGYQLKAIRMILHNKNPEDAGVSVPDSAAPGPLPACKTNLPVNTLSAEERMAQFRELMSDIVGHAIAQNNEALTLDISKEIRETVLKEMNYLIREQNDMTEERYRQLSAEIRGKLQKKHTLFSKKEKVPKMKTSKKEKNRKNVLNPV